MKIKKGRCTRAGLQLVVGLCSVLLFAACNSGSDNSGQTGDDISGKLGRVPLSSLQLNSSNDCGDVKGYIKTSLIKQYASIPRYSYYRCRVSSNTGTTESDRSTSDPVPASSDGAADAGTAAGSAGSAGNSSPSDVSDTNNQEVGVNEDDIVKADADGNIYVLSGRHFIVTDAFPPTSMSKIAEIDLGVRGLKLFLDKVNQRIVILARNDAPYYITANRPIASDDAASAISFAPSHDYSVLLFYDVSNPASPQLIDQVRTQGYYQTGRRVDDRLHLVSNHYMYPGALFSDSEFNRLRQIFFNEIYSAPCTDSDGDISQNPEVLAAQTSLTEHISAYIDGQDVSSLLPKAERVNDGAVTSIPFLSCGDIQYPAIESSLGLQVVSSVDSDGQNLAATAIVNNSYITYASENNLYLVDNSQNWWWRGDDNTWPVSQASIHQFTISGNAPQYVATGRVDGYVNNQFSLSEYNGVLRVATTQNDTSIVEEDGITLWRWNQTNHLSVLRQNNTGQLNVIGEVRDFGNTENIRSARFYGDQGFVVTFRNIDPLYTFDLSVPEDPQLKGYLEIPGFSTYIHQYDENTLLTIGRSGGTNGIGVGNGIQLQLIDVSDMSNPEVIHNHTNNATNGWSWSAAEYDHKAFTFYKPENLLAIPLHMQVPSMYSSTPFNGIVVFDVNLRAGIEPIGRIDHSDLAYEYYCNGAVSLAAPYVRDCTNLNYTYWASPRRSIVMTDSVNDDVLLYTLSDVGIKATSIAEFDTTISSILFPTQPYPWWYFHYIDVGVPTVSVADSPGGASTSVPSSDPTVVGG